jgi:hypothetical protein
VIACSFSSPLQNASEKNVLYLKTSYKKLSFISSCFSCYIVSSVAFLARIQCVGTGSLPGVDQGRCVLENSLKQCLGDSGKPGNLCAYIELVEAAPENGKRKRAAPAKAEVIKDKKRRKRK